MKRQSSFNRNRKDNTRKERVVMIASSVFVLAALTMTGIYVRRSNEKTENDGYHIDFNVLEDDSQNFPVQDKIEEIAQAVDTEDMAQALEEEIPDREEIAEEEDGTMSQILENDLDYLPTEPVDSGEIAIPGLTDVPVTENEEGLLQNEGESFAEELAADQAAMDADAGRVTENTAPSYTAGEALVWPVSGNVLIPYSMDKTVPFATLQQYKYNPAVVMAAGEGDLISAAAGGMVTRVFSDEEIGNAVTVDIGGGYTVTYGQLKDIAVTEGSYVEKGGVIGYIAAPTKYYSVEGTNAYFALQLNGKPVDPMGALQ